jgi:hypothetical protein
MLRWKLAVVKLFLTIFLMPLFGIVLATGLNLMWVML